MNCMLNKLVAEIKENISFKKICYFLVQQLIAGLHVLTVK